MEFQEAKQIANDLENQVAELSKELNKFPRGAMELVPNEVKQSDEYKQASTLYNLTFAKYQKFNQWYVKEYKKELAKERKAKYASLAQSNN
ncbi:hypothetical protein D3C85_1227430 [compost metagenome]